MSYRYLEMVLQRTIVRNEMEGGYTGWNFKP